MRFVSYYSNLDAMIIPASNAKIEDPRLCATNVLVKDAGHMSLLISQQLIASMLEVLSNLDERPDATVTPLAKRRARRGAHGA